MPHQCVRCGTMYDDGASEILKGCSECTGKLFFYIKKSSLEDAKREAEKLTLSTKEKEQIEHDIYNLIGNEIDVEKPIVLDIESVRVLKPGKYELDLIHLFKGEPLVFKLEEGKYVIDLPASFTQLVGKGKKK